MGCHRPPGGTGDGRCVWTRSSWSRPSPAMLVSSSFWFFMIILITVNNSGHCKEIIDDNNHPNGVGKNNPFNHHLRHHNFFVNSNNKPPSEVASSTIVLPLSSSSSLSDNDRRRHRSELDDDTRRHHADGHDDDDDDDSTKHLHHHHNPLFSRRTPPVIRDGEQSSSTFSHPLLSIVNFSSSSSDVNEWLPTTASSSSSSRTSRLLSASRSAEPRRDDADAAPNNNLRHGPINQQQRQNGNVDIVAESLLRPSLVSPPSSNHPNRMAKMVLMNNGSKDKNHGGYDEDGDDVTIAIDHHQRGQRRATDRDVSEQDVGHHHHHSRRSSKIGHEFHSGDTDAPALVPSARPNSKDLSRSQPSANSGGGSSMDDLLGGLAQLLGGNLKLPTGGGGTHQPPPPPPPPPPPFQSAGPSDQSNKFAQLLAQMTGGGNPNMGLNQRIPPQLAHLIPRGPNGMPLLPAVNFGLPPKLPPGLRPPSAGQFMPPGGQPNAGGGNYPFQIPFIPLLSAGSANRPAAIPLNNPGGPKPSGHSNNFPPMHGLSKPEMDALFHQLVGGGHGSNRTNQLISNLMSNFGKPTASDNSYKIDQETIVPFNLNDSGRLRIQPSLASASGQEPQIITMGEAPSVFEMVVKQKMGPTSATSAGNNVRPTPTLSSTTRTVVSTLTSPVIESSLAAPHLDVTEIRNHHTQATKPLGYSTQTMTTTGTTSTTTVTTTAAGTSSTTAKPTDVVYGKRISTTTTMTSVQPTTTTTSTHRTEAAIVSTASVTVSPTVSFGKPVVMPMPIENVKPKVHSPMEPPVGKSASGSIASPTTTNNNRISDSKPTLIKSNIRTIEQPTASNTSTSATQKKSLAKPYVRRPSFRPRPNVPIVRIDTCIVGDDSTCDVSLNEKCITELGLSSCQCRPGFARTIPRTPCVPVISLALSFRVDKMAGNKVQFTRALLNPNSEEYQYLEFESMHALNTLFAASKSLNQDLMALKVNRFYSVGGRLVVNATVSLRSNDSAPVNSQRIKRTLQQELTQAIIDANNNLGESQLSVESSTNAIARIDDLNECSSPDYNDCSKNARCINEFGGFRCECEPGYEDKFPEDRWQSGRVCAGCSPSYCSNRGECLIVKGERVCRCRANFIGSQCDIDAEVLGVAIGGSIAALVIIVITFICLYMWNQRFRQEQQKIEAMSAASGHTFSYLNSKPVATLSRMSIDERYGGGGGGGVGRSSWRSVGHGQRHHYSSDSQQHLLSSANGYYSGSNGSGASGNLLQASDHHHHHHNHQQNASHVYAQPVRVVPTGGNTPAADYDYGGHHSDVWTTSGRPRAATTTNTKPKSLNRNTTASTTTAAINSGPHSIHYPYGLKHESYNETEFSTRELIYSPATHHLYSTNPRHQTHAYY